MVSSATFAAFSKPVIAKNASATPAMIAKTGLPSALNSPSVEKSALPCATYTTPMTITITRPATSTKVITMLATTDSVMPMKLTIGSTTMNDQADQQRRRQVPDLGEVLREAGGQRARGREARREE